MPLATSLEQRAYQRGWIAGRRSAFFEGKTCAWCESTDRLELHHRDPSQKVAHAIWSWSAARRAAEIAKCIVLCGGCHQRAHSEARRLEAELRNPHGTVNRYKLGCRCDACRQGNRDKQRARKAARATA